MRCGLLGTVKSVVGGVERRGQAHHARGDRPAAHVRGDARRRRHGVRDGGLLARARAAPRGRHPLGGGGVHQPDPGPPRLPPDMEDYFLAKRRLFEVAEGPRVVNVDDAYGRRLAAEFECVTFGLAGAARLRAGAAGGRAPAAAGPLQPAQRARRAGGGGGARRHASPAGALGRVALVPGRFEPVDEGQPFAVLVDYAHTPDSLDNVLRAARELTSGRVDLRVRRRRRPRPRQAPADGGDRRRGWPTWRSSPPTTRAPRTRRRSSTRSRPACTGPHEREVDRRAAIERAVALAEPGDVVVIAGKGHEQGQEFADGRKEPFDDRVVAAEALRAVRS